MGSRNPVGKKWNPVELQLRHVEIVPMDCDPRRKD